MNVTIGNTNYPVELLNSIIPNESSFKTGEKSFEITLTKVQETVWSVISKSVAV